MGLDAIRCKFNKSGGDIWSRGENNRKGFVGSFGLNILL